MKMKMNIVNFNVNVNITLTNQGNSVRPADLGKCRSNSEVILKRGCLHLGGKPAVLFQTLGLVDINGCEHVTCFWRNFK